MIVCECTFDVAMRECVCNVCDVCVSPCEYMCDA